VSHDTLGSDGAPSTPGLRCVEERAQLPGEGAS